MSETTPNPKNRGLGRGLNALFEDEEGVYPQIDAAGDTPGRPRQMLGTDQLIPWRTQPRRIFRADSLEELAESIKEHGVLQPLLVRAHPDSAPDAQPHYEIIAGERRWQAAQQAQLHEVPVIVLEVDDIAAFKIALIENLQRQDLDPIDEALGYQKLMEDFGHTQEQISKALSKSRSHIANMMRLLTLPSTVQAHVSAGDISIGHARALITAKNPEELVKKVIAQGLSVRQTERFVAEIEGRPQKAKIVKDAPIKASPKDADTLALENEISTTLGMRVSIDSPSGKAGSVKIQFKSLDQLDELIRLLTHTTTGLHDAIKETKGVVEELITADKGPRLTD